jgi:hypothetical protein
VGWIVHCGDLEGTDGRYPKANYLEHPPPAVTH